MPYSIKAYFPLGFYQGRGMQGVLERFPTPARLHAALIAGAYSLERLEGRYADDLSPLDQSVLDWLESCPPDAILVPRSFASEGNAIAYRNTGRIGQNKKTKITGDASKKADRAPARCFLDGSLCWFWAELPPDGIRYRIEQIIQEVPYLGEAACPVILGASPVESIPEGALRRCAPAFDAAGLAIARPGRYEAWQEGHKKAQKPIKKDAASSNEEEASAEYPAASLGTAYYRNDSTALCERDTNAPWICGYMLQATGCSDKRLSQEDYVEWSVCLHRAIVKQFGDALPKCLQRMAPDGHSLANGVAIQVLSDDLPISDEYAFEGNAFIVMLPKGTSLEEEQLVLQALANIRKIYSRDLGKADVVLTGERIDLSRFWTSVPEGCHRIFRPMPLFIPDTRPPAKKKPDGSKWTLDDDARVAIGHVWRDEALLSVKEKGDAGRIALSEQVEKAGVKVFGGRIIPTSNIRRYVHKTQKGSMLVGGQAFIDLTAMGYNEYLMAIGQTRHLGGGLLVPTDLPGNLVETVAKGQ